MTQRAQGFQVHGPKESMTMLSSIIKANNNIVECTLEESRCFFFYLEPQSGFVGFGYYRFGL